MERKAPPKAGQCSTDHQRKGLQENGIDTHCLSGALVFAHSTQMTAAAHFVKDNEHHDRRQP